MSKLGLLKHSSFQMAGDYWKDVGPGMYVGDPGILSVLKKIGRGALKLAQVIPGVGVAAQAVDLALDVREEARSQRRRPRTLTREQVAMPAPSKKQTVEQPSATLGWILARLKSVLPPATIAAISRMGGARAIAVATFLLRSPALLAAVIAGTYTLEQVAEMAGVRGGAGFIGASRSRKRRRRTGRGRASRKRRRLQATRRSRRSRSRARSARRRPSRYSGRRSRSQGRFVRRRRPHGHRIVSRRGDPWEEVNSPSCDLEDEFYDGRYVNDEDEYEDDEIEEAA